MALSSIFSMTGYATITEETVLGTVTIELKSVNSRFLDLQFRMNDDLHTFEAPFREIISKRIARGKVECRLSFAKKETSAANASLIPETLKTLANLQQQVHQFFPDAKPLTTNDILRWPGVIAEAAISEETLQEQVFSILDKTITHCMESREREGAALKDVILERVTAMEAIVVQITPCMPKVVAAYQQKVITRMQESLGIALQNAPTTTPTHDEVMERVRQEVTLYGVKLDVAEELSRLTTHLNEIRHILNKGGTVGKRLDFMMQELNREANTLGSKAAIKELADASIELKILIDQMREQIQNIE